MPLLRALPPLKDLPADQPAVVAWALAVTAVYERAKPVAQGPPLPGAPGQQQSYREVVAAAVALGAADAQGHGHPGPALAQRLLRPQGDLCTCGVVAGVPADHHHAAERLLRPLVVGRTISGGSRRPRGAATRMTLSSLFATWLTQGLTPLDECRRLLQPPLPQV